MQYRETDFAFVSRLMEEEGIFYYFRHENGKHTLVLADDATAYYELDDSQVEFGDPNHTSGNQDQIKEWQHGYSYQPGKFAHTDYNFKTPAKILMATENTVVNFANNKAFEVYDYHGRHRDTERGRALARVRMEALEVSHNVAHGESTYRSFSPGGKFKFERHRTRAEVGQSYLLSYVETLASLGDSYITGVGEGEFEFKNRFRCISADTVYRPPSDTPKPVVEGPQTAVVVGPAGEEIYTDEHSRVKVQFHWDREGRKDEYSSCWIRVSQAHAGKGWGYIDIPRIGEAVIVDFLEGDPDAPIIIGRVYNANVMPPFPLDGNNNSTNKTRRGNTTKTYKGSGYNEMSMDDTPGKEQIRIHGQYNMDSVVENNETLKVGVDQSAQVGNNETMMVGVDQTESVGSNQTLTVGANQTETIGANQSSTVGANRTVSVGANQTVTVGSNQTNTTGTISTEMVGAVKTKSIGVGYALTVGGAMNTAVGMVSAEEVGLIKTIIAGSKIIFSCGGSKISMDAGGKIKIEGTQILMSASGPVKINGSVIDLN